MYFKLYCAIFTLVILYFSGGAVMPMFAQNYSAGSELVNVLKNECNYPNASTESTAKCEEQPDLAEQLKNITESAALEAQNNIPQTAEKPANRH